MGRKARRRAEERDAGRPHGLRPDEQENHAGRPDRCPRCGSTHVVTMQQALGVPPAAPGIDVVCLNCNWQGKANAYWG